MIYLYYGSDEYTRSEAVQALRAALPPDVRHLNITTLEGRKLKLNDLAVACEAFPFLADSRLVIVSNALKHIKAGKPREELRAYLDQVPPTCQLVFVEEDIDKRNALVTYIKKHGTMQEFVPRQGASLFRWIDEQAKARRAKIARDAAEQLVNLASNDSRTLVTELDKLASYVGTGGQITTDVVQLLVQDSQEHNLFAFLDSLSLRKRGDAMHGLRTLINDGQAPAYILFMLARQVRILLGVRELAGQRMRPNDIASHLRLNPFVVKKALDQIQGFSQTELERLHNRLVELDHATKTGRIQADVALDLFVLEACAR